MNQAEIRFRVKRHDKTQDRSLKAWSAADEYLLHAFSGIEDTSVRLAIYHDRFGFLSTHLHGYHPSVVIINKSQEHAITANFRHIHIAVPAMQHPMASFDEPIELALMKVPKSLDLFQYYLDHISRNSTEWVNVICAFMTRHFSPRMLEIADQYFNVAEQSKARKKARLLTLSGKKDLLEPEIITEFEFNDVVYRQYPGVFSAGHVDYGTQFLLDHVVVSKTDRCVLDLGSGNGIIGNELLRSHPDIELHLMDDSVLAVASARLNVQGEKVHHHWSDDLSIFDDGKFDLIVLNPPFHFEYETNIYIALDLFKGCLRTLKEGGALQLVANRHLNYKTHLDHLFRGVDIVAESEKYVVYKCVKRAAI